MEGQVPLHWWPPQCHSIGPDVQAPGGGAEGPGGSHRAPSISLKFWLSLLTGSPCWDLAASCSSAGPLAAGGQREAALAAAKADPWESARLFRSPLCLFSVQETVHVASLPLFVLQVRLLQR